jgi:hypothetical protein
MGDRLAHRAFDVLAEKDAAPNIAIDGHVVNSLVEKRAGGQMRKK